MKLILSLVLAVVASGCAVAPIDGNGGNAVGKTTVVCHKGKKTMELPEEAVRAHLNHGDRLGPC